MDFIDVDVDGSTMNIKGKKVASSTNFEQKSWPDVARPIIILASVGADGSYVSDLTLKLIEALSKWNNNKKSFQNKVKLMVSVIGYNSVSTRVYRNSNKEVRSFSIPGCDVVTLMLPLVEEPLSEIREDFSNFYNNIVFDLQDLNKNKLFSVLNSLTFPRFIRNTYFEKLSSVTKTMERIVNFCSNQRTWLTPCVILISDGSVMYSVRERLNQWKMSFAHMRLYSLEPDNFSEDPMIFSKEDIDGLARAVVQYVDYIHVPRIKKKSVGDCFAVQLPILEGALYDND